MKFSKVFSCILISLLSFAISSSSAQKNGFLNCLISNHLAPEIIYTPDEPSYLSVYNSTLQNHRFINSSSVLKPLAIVTPREFSQVQASVYCARKYGIQLRTRSGGHDFEGLSYVSYRTPFVIIDLVNLRTINVDVATESAWVQAGATLGQVYYRIAEKSPNLAFPGGTCPTVGVGGHISGGGYGALMRKYGLAGDNVLDAYIVNAEGYLLNRKSMGEDMFWAIRGGGAASYGIVVAWKLQLVRVPTNVTVFNVIRNLESDENKNLVDRWQYVADKLPSDLLIFVRLMTANSSTNSSKVSIRAIFTSLYLGGIDTLLPIVQKALPELGLVRGDCTEMSWIESAINIAGYPSGTPREFLLERIADRRVTQPYKGKLDYAKNPIPINAMETMWKRLAEEAVGAGLIQLFPYGGRMSEISETETPFPHRAGYLYTLLYYLSWEDGATTLEHEKHVNWTRSVYNYMTPYVTKNPRAGYVNYRDLDLGVNNDKGPISYAQASIWGLKYFDKNFRKLVQVKTRVDPTNFFRNEQSIPSLTYTSVSAI